LTSDCAPAILRLCPISWVRRQRIAWFREALALAAVLYTDARLTCWGIRPPAWSTVLRWFTGLAATHMNTWTSLWPDGRPGWPSRADPAAVLLHAVPPLLLILLTETVAAYRRHLTPYLTRTGPEPDRPRIWHERRRSR
jgi:hypothetical protein